MSTTTIRFEDDLKSRVAVAAARAGKTAHAFIVDAITLPVETSEVADDFDRVAEQRWGALLATGKTVGLDDAAAYLQARARGQRLKKPAAKELVGRPAR